MPLLAILKYSSNIFVIGIKYINLTFMFLGSCNCPLWVNRAFKMDSPREECTLVLLTA